MHPWFTVPSVFTSATVFSRTMSLHTHAPRLHPHLPKALLGVGYSKECSTYNCAEQVHKLLFAEGACLLALPLVPNMLEGLLICASMGSDRQLALSWLKCYLNHCPNLITMRYNGCLRSYNALPPDLLIDHQTLTFCL